MKQHLIIFPISVWTPPQKTCTKPVHITVRSQSTYIASLTTVDSHCGHGNNPLVLEALQGQGINITLYDFSWYQHRMAQGCVSLYGRILTTDTNDIVDICGGSVKEKMVFTSTTSQVQVIIEENLDSESRFMLKVEGIHGFGSFLGNMQECVIL